PVACILRLAPPRAFNALPLARSGFIRHIQHRSHLNHELTSMTAQTVAAFDASASVVLARARIRLTRQRLSRLSGRHSTIKTRSPTWLSLRSSCAFTLVLGLSYFFYFGCITVRSTETMTVFCIRSLITHPIRSFLSPLSFMPRLFHPEMPFPEGWSPPWLSHASFDLTSWDFPICLWPVSV